MEGANYTVMMASKLAGSTKPELLTKHRLAAETQKRLDLDMIYKVCMCVYYNCSRNVRDGIGISRHQLSSRRDSQEL